MRLIALIEQGALEQRMLRHLGRVRFLLDTSPRPADNPRMAAVRRPLLGAIVLLGSVALALVVGVIAVEIWTRARWDPKRGRPGFFVSDPVRIEKLGRDYTGWFAGVPVRVNRLGFRDTREYSLEKPPGTFRIIVFGDSVTFGHGSVYEHTYPFLLEQELRKWRPEVSWQVWNLGVPGYNTSQELAYLREVGPLYHPDLVVVGFYDNDVLDNFEPSTPTRRQRLLSDVLNLLRRHVYSIEFYRRTYLILTARLPEMDESERLLADTGRVADLDEQALRPLHPVTPEELDAAPCLKMSFPVNTDVERDDLLVAGAREDPGLRRWRTAVEGFHELNRTSAYRVVFFVNNAPGTCGDLFDGRKGSVLNAYFLRTLGNGAFATSSYDAFLRYRPSEMPLAGGHSIGNSNLVKARALAEFLEQQLLPRR